MSDRDLFHENHVAMSMEFKAWTDTHIELGWNWILILI